MLATLAVLIASAAQAPAPAEPAAAASPSSPHPVVRSEVRFEPTAAEADVPEPFRLPAATFGVEMERLRREASGLEVWAVRFPSPRPSGDPVNDTVHAELFLPAGAGPGSRRPAVVVLHILGADFPLARYVAVRLAQRGVVALFLKLPYYGERRPAEGTRFLSADIGRSMAAMRQGVADVRRGSAFLASRPEVDPAKRGVTGISLGGIVAALAAEADPAIDRAALMLAGGGLARILWEMPEPGAAAYRLAWSAAGKDFDDLEALTLPVDPLTYAGRLRGKRVLMLNGNVDEVIPPRAALDLWEQAGRPPIRWFDCGHYSAVGYLLPAIREVADFFAQDVPAA